MDYEAVKRMEDFAKEILSQTPAMQKKMWEALDPILTGDEILGLKSYVGLFHMFTDNRFYEAVKKSVGEQIYNELHKYNTTPRRAVYPGRKEKQHEILPYWI